MIIPIIILIILSSVELGLAWGYHGRKKTGKHNAWVTLITLIMAWSLVLWIIFSK